MKNSRQVSLTQKSNKLFGIFVSLSLSLSLSLSSSLMATTLSEMATARDFTVTEDTCSCSGFMHVTTSQTWATNMTIDQHVIIDPGVVLTIGNATIKFKSDCKVLVNRNARLNISGVSSKLTGSIACVAADIPLPWGGIQVWGTQDQPHPTYSQVISNSGYLNANHGIVYLSSGTIEYVKDFMAGAGAIAAGPSWPFDQFLPSGGSATWINHFGGIAITTGGEITQCRKGVELQAYPATGQTNESICRFVDTDMSFCGEGIINSGAQGVGIYACVFQNNSPGSTRGVVDLNARMTIGGSLFKKLAHGIDVLSPTSINMQVKIGNLTNNLQSNLFESCKLGIWAQGTDNLEIGNNFFSNPTNQAAYVGIWLDGENSYTIGNNEFSDLYQAVQMLNTHAPPTWAALSCNQYEDSEYSMVSMGDNSSLTFSNEDFENSGEDLRYEEDDVNQGSIPDQGYGTNAVYNYFSPQIPIANFVSAGNTVTFNYYHPFGSGVSAELIPHCAINDGCSSITSNHYNNKAQFGDFSCPHEPNEELFCETEACLDSLRIQIDSLESLIDGGDTEGLLNLINTSPESSSTVTALLADSPYLSDDVLIAVIQATGMAESDKRTILVANALLQRQVVEAAIQEELNEATLVAIDTIDTPSGRSILQQEIRGLNYLYWAGLREMILAFPVDSTGYTACVSLVNAQDHPQADRLLYHRQVELAKWSDAQNTLDSLPSAWKAWKDIQQIVLDKSQTFGDTLTTVEESLLDSLSLEKSANGALARSLLNQLEGKLFYPFDPQNLSSERVFKPINGSNVASALAIFPNPGHGSFTINTGLTDVDPIGVLEIFDFSGRNVWNQIGLQPVHQLDLDHLKKGMYALRILTKNGPSVLKFIID